MPLILSDSVPNDDWLREQWYNALDSAVTLEIHDKLGVLNAGQLIYEFERSMQGPALEMMLRGFRIDPIWQRKNIDSYQAEFDATQEKLDRLSHAIWGRPLNPRSPDQLKDFFYNELKLPEVWINQKGLRKLSTNREALEKLEVYYYARPFISCIFAIREAGKKLSMLRYGVDADGRMRCSYNVCGTETGRWSSSRNVYNRGGNLQNITDELKRMFVADPDMMLVHIDGEQAESRSCGFIHGVLFDDWHYLDVCESEDLHTYVAKIVWPNLPWTGDRKADKAIAEQIFYRWFTYRDMAKRGGHGSNYRGQAPTMAKHLKVPTILIENFQRSYFKEFLAFPMWHAWVAGQLSTRQSITTFLGRERTFFGRPTDDTTIREAIAYEPQSTVGDIINTGGKRVWKKFPQAQVLAQTHDSYTFQIPQAQAHIIPEMISTFEVPVTHKGRTMTIPGEALVGWNWAKADPKRKIFSDGNPDGLEKWGTQSVQRRRTEDPRASLLDRVLY